MTEVLCRSVKSAPPSPEPQSAARFRSGASIPTLSWGRRKIGDVDRHLFFIWFGVSKTSQDPHSSSLSPSFLPSLPHLPRPSPAPSPSQISPAEKPRRPVTGPPRLIFASRAGRRRDIAEYCRAQHHQSGAMATPDSGGGGEGAAAAGLSGASSAR